MSIFGGAHGLSYLQIGALFATLAGGQLAAGGEPENRSPAAAFFAVLVSLRGLGAIVLFGAAAVLMVWPPTGSPPVLVFVLVAVLAFVGVGSYAAYDATRQAKLAAARPRRRAPGPQRPAPGEAPPTSTKTKAASEKRPPP